MQPTATTARQRMWVRPIVLVVLIAIVVVAVLIPTVILPRIGSTTAQAVSCPTVTPTVRGSAGNFKPDVIYQVVLDRFFDGNSQNNDPAVAKGLFDATRQNWHDYWGGDLAGLTQKLPYIAGMGATAIWLSPVVDNTHVPLDYGGAPQAGYHGYWARDFYQIDPHLGTWQDFDTLITTAHTMGLKIMIDYVPNHSNPEVKGESGSLYKNGVLQASYVNDPNNWFHHNGSTQDFNNTYERTYNSLFDLADLAQENPAVDAYLKGSINLFLDHNIDGIRIDSVKHMPAGWIRTLNDTVQSRGPHYIIGEWFLASTTDASYAEARQLANQSGTALVNFPANIALRTAFGNNKSTAIIDGVVTEQQKNLLYPNDQAVFIDNHDMPRFLNLTSDKGALHDALAVAMTIPGVPIIYYGTEQYISTDIDGGNDPYNRQLMTGYNTTTPAYRMIRCLANLRQTNPALAYGGYQARKVSHDVYVYERTFGNNTVVVAVNQGIDAAALAGVPTSLPVGSYADYLKGIMHGQQLTVGADGTMGNYTLQSNEIAVWQVTAPVADTVPVVGSVAPEQTHAGNTMTIAGTGLSMADVVTIGGRTATITQATPTLLTVTVPETTGGVAAVVVCTTASVCSKPGQVTLTSGAQVPVTFTVSNVPALTAGDGVYLTGSIPELGGGRMTPDTAIGLLHPDITQGKWLIMASVPACQNVTYQLVIIRADGTVQPMANGNQQYTVPCTGTGTAHIDWR